VSWRTLTRPANDNYNDNKRPSWWARPRDRHHLEDAHEVNAYYLAGAEKQTNRPAQEHTPIFTRWCAPGPDWRKGTRRAGQWTSTRDGRDAGDLRPRLGRRTTRRRSSTLPADADAPTAQGHRFRHDFDNRISTADRSAWTRRTRTFYLGRHDDQCLKNVPQQLVPGFAQQKDEDPANFVNPGVYHFGHWMPGV